MCSSDLKLVSQGFISEGLRRGNQKSYYVTLAGIEWMKDAEKDVDEKKEVCE